MSTSPETDPALETLLATALEIAPALEKALIEKVYLLQKKHQFDQGNDREACIRALEKVLDDHLQIQDGSSL